MLVACAVVTPASPAPRAISRARNVDLELPSRVSPMRRFRCRCLLLMSVLMSARVLKAAASGDGDIVALFRPTSQTASKNPQARRTRRQALDSVIAGYCAWGCFRSFVSQQALPPAGT